MWTNEDNKPADVARYGVTAPISESGPKPVDNEKTQELETVLNAYDNLETEEELNHRMEILARLNDMVNEWVIELAISQNMPEEIAASVGGRITTFGSYRLGVHSKGSDIDALCIAPRHVTRADYFTSFFEKLKDCSEVKELRVSYWLQVSSRRSVDCSKTIFLIAESRRSLCTPDSNEFRRY